MPVLLEAREGDFSMKQKRILARLYLPAISATRTPEELRVIDLARRPNRTWVAELMELYAQLGRSLPTFF